MKYINLSKGYITVVDDEDFEWLSKFNWYANIDQGKYVSARANHNGTNIIMARLIMSAFSEEYVVDHINRNPLDNRRKNLRLCTKSQNSQNIGLSSRNTSGYRGVNYHKNTKKWVARIGIDGSRKYIGYYDTPESAARAYDHAARQVHGEFAWLNFPKQEEYNGR